MALSARNWEELAKHGAALDNVDYVFVKCSRCGAIAMYDEERMQLYLDARDLRQSDLYGTSADDSALCPVCGQQSTFADTTDADQAAVEASAWARFL